jgi:mono/diheme cytochrome c family protein
MDAETLFIILGLSLVALALVVSFLGLRMGRFPPTRGAMLAGISVFVLVVGATAVFAWQGAEDEQEHRDEEIASGEEPSPAETMAEMEAAAAAHTAEEEGAPPPGEEPPPDGAPATASADGAALFESEGCAGCHTLEAAGATGTVGPDLDVTLKGTDVAFIEESIVDPEAELAKGFPSGVMPADFGDVLSPEELDALVLYIADSVGAEQ